MTCYEQSGCMPLLVQEKAGCVTTGHCHESPQTSAKELSEEDRQKKEELELLVQRAQERLRNHVNYKHCIFQKVPTLIRLACMLGESLFTGSEPTAEFGFNKDIVYLVYISITEPTLSEGQTSLYQLEM